MNSLRHAFESAYGRLSARERRLVTVFTVLTAAALAWLAVVEPLARGRARLEQRIERLERELPELAELAARIRRLEREVGDAAGVDSAQDFSLFSFVDRATAATIAREAVSAMSPTRRPIRDGYEESAVEVKLNGVSLGEIVRLLETIRSADRPVYVKRFEMKRRYDDRTRFEAVIVIATLTRS